MTDRIKIAYVLPVQSPYMTRRLAALAEQPGFEITLLLERASFEHRPGWQPASIAGVRIEVLGSTILKTTRQGDDLGYRISGIRSIPWRLALRLLGLKPDLAVVCNATELLLALPSKYLAGARIALMVEDTPHAARNLPRLLKPFKSWLYRRADRWIAFSDGAEQFLHEIGIQHGILRSSWSLDMNEFKPLGAGTPIPNQATAVTRRHVTFIGALTNNKGVMHLLHNWSRLPAEIRGNSNLHIVGTGPLHAEIECLISERGMPEVELLGQIPYAEVGQLLQHTDLLVLPTLQDLYSLTVLEAMACGCAVITTPFNGASELIDSGINGWVVDPTQPEALTAALRHALSNQVDLPRMGLAARARVEHMDNAIVMANLAKDLRDLAFTRK